MFNGITTHVINPAIYADLGYHTINDFAPITEIAETPLVIVAHPSFSPKTVGDLITVANAQPGGISYGSFGLGSISHLAGELFNQMAGVNLVHVPYRGGGPALIDVLGGQVPMAILGITPVLPHINAGKLRGIAVTGLQRAKQLPTLPAVAETPALKGFNATIMYGMWAPANTSREVISHLHDVVANILQLPQVRSRFEHEGASDPTPTSPEETARFIKAEMEKVAKLVKVAGIKAQ
jgi:tripartite-type tricarboxylate transporter receptor subunit TctC